MHSHHGIDMRYVELYFRGKLMLDPLSISDFINADEEEMHVSVVIIGGTSNESKGK